VRVESESYEVRWSARRKRTMSIHRAAGRLVVTVPAQLTPGDVERVVPRFVERYLAREGQRRLPRGDAELTARAKRLYRDHLLRAAGPAPEFSIRWSTRQRQRWGSCTTANGTIRISERVRPLPDWVGDYVLVHELAHLFHVDHSPAFWTLVRHYPLADRAHGYLEGYSAATGLPDEV
jgi:predicted metal-dependent hydrolase